MNRTSEELALDELARLEVSSCLGEHGWSASDGAARATKPFETAAGERTALVYFRSGPHNPVLTGDYQSEGRNRLESCMALIPKTASHLEIRRLTAKFAVAGEAVIADTYARRIFLND